ncbi:unnamed protein product [Caenorhabditis angaria]|uniref:C3H1-type domain-containing protein n=1 Tax=Caenorhabditis angaria TaxID=860376 RepID=A0A9P1I994_9PELO|nr:unnamed protein product [Caenorhabditis angaria]
MTDSESSSESKSSKKSMFEEIQVIELNRSNFQQIWPYLLISIKSADFIGLDLELSGLGGKGLRSKDIQERYQAIREAAKTRSILSLGIATLKLVQKNEKKKRLRYQAQVFNIITLSEKPFTIEPNALKFLARHNFDFNKLIKLGVQFQGASGQCPLKALFFELFSSSSSLCLHNGLVDLAFIYQQFYGAELPDNLDKFCCNLADLFPLDFLPVLDSKYLAEYSTRLPSSYLEYVFRRSQGDNLLERENSRFWVDVVFPEHRMEIVKQSMDVVKCALPDGFPNHPIPVDLHNHVCNSFAHHGFCQNPQNCVKLHDVDSAIDLQRIKENKKAFKRKRRYHNIISEGVVEEQLENEMEWKKAKFENNLKVRDIKEKIVNRMAENGLHRAGVDAFMTAFSVIFQQRLELARDNSVSVEHANKLPLSGKDQPLQLTHRQIIGTFENHEHLENLAKIEKNREFVRNNAAKSMK